MPILNTYKLEHLEYKIASKPRKANKMKQILVN